MHSTSQHSTTRWSDQRAFHQPTQHHMVVRSSCIPPANTAPHGGQTIVHSTSQHTTTRWSDYRASTSQHSTTWWSDHRAFHQSTQHHMVTRPKACEERGEDFSSSARSPPVGDGSAIYEKHKSYQPNRFLFEPSGGLGGRVKHWVTRTQPNPTRCLQ